LQVGVVAVALAPLVHHIQTGVGVAVVALEAAKAETA
jgi:hypothetical protein